jgi:hypothetical protein
MRRKWATIGYRIFRVSHFLRVISRLSPFPLVTSWKLPPAIVDINPSLKI